VPAQHRDWVPARERGPAGQHFIEHDVGRIQIDRGGVHDVGEDDGEPDPASATDLGVSFREVSGHLADLEGTLQTLTRPDAWGDWTGLAADAFGQSIGQLPAELGDMAGAYGKAASALQRYAGQLEPVVNSLTGDSATNAR
jgi:uncharacterized protein YukE